MLILRLNIYKSWLTLGIVSLIMFISNISAQTNSLTLHDMIGGQNKIFLYDPQSVTPPPLDPLPSNTQISNMSSGIYTNWKDHQISSTNSQLTLQLITNEDTIQPSPAKRLISLNIKVKYLKTNGSLDSLEKIRLHTAFNNLPNTPYIFYNSLKIDSVVFAYIEVEGIKYEDATISPLLFDHVITGHDTIDEINSITPIRFIATLDPIHVYRLSTVAPANGSSLATCNVYAGYNDVTGNIRVDWKAANMPSEVSYTELQWTFVNTYPAGPSNPNAIYDFRMNNSSVQVTSPGFHYNLPMIFEKGILIFRIRWVSLRGDDLKPVYSSWSLPESGTIGRVICGKFEITTDRIHEGDRKNWQCIMTYAEEGKHKAVVTYYDGTMRNRQAVTRLSESNTIIVGETIYDFQGRPAIQVLPVPVGLSDHLVASSSSYSGIDGATDHSTYSTWQASQETIMMDNLGLLGTGTMPSSTSSVSTEVIPEAPGQYLPQKIQYYRDFNVNNADDAYSWENFDTGTLCDNTKVAEAMTNSKGASRYYSPNNDDQSGFNANIPNANGFPFTQVEYTPDNTGRICRQGTVGETFQLRRGHDTRFYYGSPSQDELDRIFGSDAGDAVYYKKNMITDGNGQTAIEYLDMKGKVVASGLAGSHPANLDRLENIWRFRNTMNLLAADVRVQNELKNTLRSTTRLLIEQNNTLVTFEYDLPAKQFPKDLCPGTRICLDCQYDYTIQVLDECGSIRWNTSQQHAGADIINKTCNPVGNIGRDSSLVLQRGVYTVSRILSVSAESIEKYGLLYDTNAICLATRDSLKLAGHLNFPRRGCNLTCENCEEETYANRHAGDLVKNMLNGISMPYKITQADIDRDRAHCNNLCDTTTSNLENILSMMRSDVSINGMYGETNQHTDDDTTTYNINEERDSINPGAFPLSVFNSSNLLGEGNRNWKYPSKNRFNPRGHKYYEKDTSGTLVESWVTIPISREPQYRYPGNPGAYAIAAGKYRIENGRLQIKPEALRDVREFMEAWKDEWANALLPYHPEYPTLLWYIGNSASNDYDEKLNSILSYAEAESFASGITNVNQDVPEILNRDRYFSERDHARRKIKEKLFASVGGYSTRPLETMALSGAYCAIENLSASELLECLGTRRLYENPDRKDIEWQMVRALYIQYKHHIQDSLRSGELQLRTTDDQYSNELSAFIHYADPSTLNIGDKSTPVSNFYRNKVMRLPTQNDIMKNMIDCAPLEREISGIRYRIPNMSCMQDKATSMLQKECDKCPITQSLETFLSVLASSNKLTTNSSEELAGRIITTSEMLSSLGSPNIRRINLSPVISGNQLMITISAQEGFTGTGTEYNQFINLKSIDPAIQWNKLRTIRCLKFTDNPRLYANNGKNFTVRGIDDYGKEFLLEGISSCFIIDSCKTTNAKPSPNKQTESENICCPPLAPPAQIPINGCESNRRKLIAFFYNQNLNKIVEWKRIELRKEYTQACLDDADAFKATMDNSIYQLTLYYYDQAGNLIRTIPPAGVDTLDREQIRTVQANRENLVREAIVPEHNLISSYKYNSLNQVIEKTSPDAGMVQLHYDSIGRVHLSQDAVQVTSNAFHYILFDKLGRISQSGQAFLEPARVRSALVSHTALKNIVNPARKEEVTYIYYDRPVNNATNRYFNVHGQQQLRNRVASSIFSANGNISNYDNATHYSYDYHGNVKTLIQENRDPILADRGQSRKRIDYDYDLISGKTNKVCYQCDSTDQFIHRYKYDADNRITNVHTGTRNDRLQQDASYIFYKHGPVARINLGDRLVQGIDYAYTLQGWLKGINSNTANPLNDMGGDGSTGSLFAGDRYGFSLHYFPNDYSSIASRAPENSFLAAPGSSLTNHLSQKGLYNGNIAVTATTINDISGPGALLHLYTYDQSQRLKTSHSYASLNSGNTWGATDTANYRTSYSYDPNGNITNLTRSAGGTQFDNLTYSYERVGNRLQNNKLETVSELASPRSLSGAGDISENITYLYDHNGNITRENSTTLEWTAGGRIKRYGDLQSYAYNAAQLRVKKTDGSASQYYVYDPAGNILAFYTYRDNQLEWSGSPIYGTKRIGMYHANKLLPSASPGMTDTLWRGHTEYELTNHLGDVLATISDKKLSTARSATFNSDIITAHEYFPFGMAMPNRTYSLTESEITSTSDAYPFAYNGMEQDLKNGADGYTTEFRQYDSRSGRWKSMDPKTEKTNSYYDGFNNNPVATTDIHGDDGSTAPEVDIFHSPSTPEDPVTPETDRSRTISTASDIVGGTNNLVTTTATLAQPLINAAGNVVDGAISTVSTEIRRASAQVRTIANRRILGPERVAQIEHARRLAFQHNSRLRTHLSTIRGLATNTVVQRGGAALGNLDRAGHLITAADQASRGDYRAAALTVAQDIAPTVIEHVIRKSPISGGRVGQAVSEGAEMISRISQDANELVSGRMGEGTYVARFAVNLVVTGASIILPVPGWRSLVHDPMNQLIYQVTH